MVAGHWSSKLGSHIFNLKHKTQSELEVRRGYKLSKPAVTTSSRKAQLNLLRVPQAQQDPQLLTKCSDTRAYERHFLCKPSQLV